METRRGDDVMRCIICKKAIIKIQESKFKFHSLSYLGALNESSTTLCIGIVICGEEEDAFMRGLEVLE